MHRALPQADLYYVASGSASRAEPGENRLTVRVTNVWPNRMIGDHRPGDQRIAYSTFDPFQPDSPLLPACLMGPVVVERLSER